MRGLGRERIHRLDEGLDDVVLGLEVDEDAGAVGEIRRDRLRGRHRLVDVARRSPVIRPSSSPLQIMSPFTEAKNRCGTCVQLVPSSKT